MSNTIHPPGHPLPPPSPTGIDPGRRPAAAETPTANPGPAPQPSRLDALQRTASAKPLDTSKIKSADFRPPEESPHAAGTPASIDSQAAIASGAVDAMNGLVQQATQVVTPMVEKALHLLKNGPPDELAQALQQLSQLFEMIKQQIQKQAADLLAQLSGTTPHSPVVAYLTFFTARGALWPLLDSAAQEFQVAHPDAMTPGKWDTTVQQGFDQACERCAQTIQAHLAQLEAAVGGDDMGINFNALSQASLLKQVDPAASESDGGDEADEEWPDPLDTAESNAERRLRNDQAMTRQFEQQQVIEAQQLEQQRQTAQSEEQLRTQRVLDEQAHQDQQRSNTGT